MGNYGSYGGGNTYVNPLIMVDNDSNYASNDYNRFACDINEDSNKTVITANTKQRVKDYTLSKSFKNMVENYDGSKQMIKNSAGKVTGSEYIASEGNNLPGGLYKDADGNKMKVYRTMACCKGAVGQDAIGIGTGANPRKSVSIPIPVVVMPNKDILKPIYSEVLLDPSTNASKQFTTFGVTVKGINSNISSFYYDPDFKQKINSLSSDQLDSIISQCANKTMCLKSNYVGLQIKTSTDPTAAGGKWANKCYKSTIRNIC